MLKNSGVGRGSEAGGRRGEWCSAELEELRLRAPTPWVDGVWHMLGVEAMLGAGTWGHRAMYSVAPSATARPKAGYPQGM